MKTTATIELRNRKGSRRVADLELALIIGRSWPQRWIVQDGEAEMRRQILDGTKDEKLPWEFQSIPWHERRIKQWLH